MSQESQDIKEVKEEEGEMISDESEDEISESLTKKEKEEIKKSLKKKRRSKKQEAKKKVRMQTLQEELTSELFEMACEMGEISEITGEAFDLQKILQEAKINMEEDEQKREKQDDEDELPLKKYALSVAEKTKQDMLERAKLKSKADRVKKLLKMLKIPKVEDTYEVIKQNKKEDEFIIIAESLQYLSDEDMVKLTSDNELNNIQNIKTLEDLNMLKQLIMKKREEIMKEMTTNARLSELSGYIALMIMNVKGSQDNEYSKIRSSIAEEMKKTGKCEEYETIVKTLLGQIVFIKIHDKLYSLKNIKEIRDLVNSKAITAEVEQQEILIESGEPALKGTNKQKQKNTWNKNVEKKIKMEDDFNKRGLIPQSTSRMSYTMALESAVEMNEAATTLTVVGQGPSDLSIEKKYPNGVVVDCDNLFRNAKPSDIHIIVNALEQLTLLLECTLTFRIATWETIYFACSNVTEAADSLTNIISNSELMLVPPGVNDDVVAMIKCCEHSCPYVTNDSDKTNEYTTIKQCIRNHFGTGTKTCSVCGSAIMNNTVKITRLKFDLNVNKKFIKIGAIPDQIVIYMTNNRLLNLRRDRELKKTPQTALESFINGTLGVYMPASLPNKKTIIEGDLIMTKQNEKRTPLSIINQLKASKAYKLKTPTDEENFILIVKDENKGLDLYLIKKRLAQKTLEKISEFQDYIEEMGLEKQTKLIIDLLKASVTGLTNLMQLQNLRAKISKSLKRSDPISTDKEENAVRSMAVSLKIANKYKEIMNTIGPAVQTAVLTKSGDCYIQTQPSTWECVQILSVSSGVLMMQYGELTRTNLEISTARINFRDWILDTRGLVSLIDKKIKAKNEIAELTKPLKKRIVTRETDLNNIIKSLNVIKFKLDEREVTFAQPTMADYERLVTFECRNIKSASYEEIILSATTSALQLDSQETISGEVDYRLAPKNEIPEIKLREASDRMKVSLMFDSHVSRYTSLLFSSHIMSETGSFSEMPPIVKKLLSKSSSSIVQSLFNLFKTTLLPEITMIDNVTTMTLLIALKDKATKEDLDDIHTKISSNKTKGWTIFNVRKYVVTTAHGLYRFKMGVIEEKVLLTQIDLIPSADLIRNILYAKIGAVEENDTSVDKFHYPYDTDSITMHYGENYPSISTAGVIVYSNFIKAFSMTPLTNNKIAILQQINKKINLLTPLWLEINEIIKNSGEDLTTHLAKKKKQFRKALKDCLNNYGLDLTDTDKDKREINATIQCIEEQFAYEYWLPEIILLGANTMITAINIWSNMASEHNQWEEKMRIAHTCDENYNKIREELETVGGNTISGLQMIMKNRNQEEKDKSSLPTDFTFSKFVFLCLGYLKVKTIGAATLQYRENDQHLVTDQGYDINLGLKKTYTLTQLAAMPDRSEIPNFMNDMNVAVKQNLEVADQTIKMLTAELKSKRTLMWTKSTKTKLILTSSLEKELAERSGDNKILAVTIIIPNANNDNAKAINIQTVKDVCNILNIQTISLQQVDSVNDLKPRSKLNLIATDNVKISVYKTRNWPIGADGETELFNFLEISNSQGIKIENTIWSSRFGKHRHIIKNLEKDTATTILIKHKGLDAYRALKLPKSWIHHKLKETYVSKESNFMTRWFKSAINYLKKMIKKIVFMKDSKRLKVYDICQNLEIVEEKAARLNDERAVVLMAKINSAKLSWQDLQTAVDELNQPQTQTNKKNKQTETKDEDEKNKSSSLKPENKDKTKNTKEGKEDIDLTSIDMMNTKKQHATMKSFKDEEEEENEKSLKEELLRLKKKENSPSVSVNPYENEESQERENESEEKEETTEEDFSIKRDRIASILEYGINSKDLIENIKWTYYYCQLIIKDKKKQEEEVLNQKIEKIGQNFHLDIAVDSIVKWACYQAFSQNKLLVLEESGRSGHLLNQKNIERKAIIRTSLMLLHMLYEKEPDLTQLEEMMLKESEFYDIKRSLDLHSDVTKEEMNDQLQLVLDKYLQTENILDKQINLEVYKRKNTSKSIQSMTEDTGASSKSFNNGQRQPKPLTLNPKTEAEIVLENELEKLNDQLQTQTNKDTLQMKVLSSLEPQNEAQQHKNMIMTATYVTSQDKTEEAESRVLTQMTSNNLDVKASQLIRTQIQYDKDVGFKMAFAMTVNMKIKGLVLQRITNRNKRREELQKKTVSKILTKRCFGINFLKNVTFTLTAFVLNVYEDTKTMLLNVIDAILDKKRKTEETEDELKDSEEKNKSHGKRKTESKKKNKSQKEKEKQKRPSQLPHEKNQLDEETNFKDEEQLTETWSDSTRSHVTNIGPQSSAKSKSSVTNKSSEKDSETSGSDEMIWKKQSNPINMSQKIKNMSSKAIERATDAIKKKFSILVTKFKKLPTAFTKLKEVLLNLVSIKERVIKAVQENTKARATVIQDIHLKLINYFKKQKSLIQNKKAVKKTSNLLSINKRLLTLATSTYKKIHKIKEKVTDGLKSTLMKIKDPAIELGRKLKKEINSIKNSKLGAPINNAWNLAKEVKAIPKVSIVLIMTTIQMLKPTVVYQVGLKNSINMAYQTNKAILKTYFNKIKTTYINEKKVEAKSEINYSAVKQRTANLIKSITNRALTVTISLVASLTTYGNDLLRSFQELSYNLKLTIKQAMTMFRFLKQERRHKFLQIKSMTQKDYDSLKITPVARVRLVTKLENQEGTTTLMIPGTSSSIKPCITNYWVNNRHKLDYEPSQENLSDNQGALLTPRLKWNERKGGYTVEWKGLNTTITIGHGDDEAQSEKDVPDIISTIKIPQSNILYAVNLQNQQVRLPGMAALINDKVALLYTEYDEEVVYSGSLIRVTDVIYMLTSSITINNVKWFILETPESKGVTTQSVVIGNPETLDIAVAIIDAKNLSDKLNKKPKEESEASKLEKESVKSGRFDKKSEPKRSDEVKKENDLTLELDTDETKGLAVVINYETQREFQEPDKGVGLISYNGFLRMQLIDEELEQYNQCLICKAKMKAKLLSHKCDKKLIPSYINHFEASDMKLFKGEKDYENFVKNSVDKLNDEDVDEYQNKELEKEEKHEEIENDQESVKLKKEKKNNKNAQNDESGTRSSEEIKLLYSIKEIIEVPNERLKDEKFINQLDGDKDKFISKILNYVKQKSTMRVYSFIPNLINGIETEKLSDTEKLLLTQIQDAAKCFQLVTTKLKQPVSTEVLIIYEEFTSFGQDAKLISHYLKTTGVDVIEARYSNNRVKTNNIIYLNQNKPMSNKTSYMLDNRHSQPLLESNADIAISTEIKIYYEDSYIIFHETTFDKKTSNAWAENLNEPQPSINLPMATWIKYRSTKLEILNTTEQFPMQRSQNWLSYISGFETLRKRINKEELRIIGEKTVDYWVIKLIDTEEKTENLKSPITNYIIKALQTIYRRTLLLFRIKSVNDYVEIEYTLSEVLQMHLHDIEFFLNKKISRNIITVIFDNITDLINRIIPGMVRTKEYENKKVKFIEKQINEIAKDSSANKKTKDKVVLIEPRLTTKENKDQKQRHKKRGEKDKFKETDKEKEITEEQKTNEKTENKSKQDTPKESESKISKKAKKHLEKTDGEKQEEKPWYRNIMRYIWADEETRPEKLNTTEEIKRTVQNDNTEETRKYSNGRKDKRVETQDEMKKGTDKPPQTSKSKLKEDEANLKRKETKETNEKSKTDEEDTQKQVDYQFPNLQDLIKIKEEEIDMTDLVKGETMTWLYFYDKLRESLTGFDKENQKEKKPDQEASNIKEKEKVTKEDKKRQEDIEIASKIRRTTKSKTARIILKLINNILQTMVSAKQRIAKQTAKNKNKKLSWKEWCYIKVNKSVARLINWIFNPFKEIDEFMKDLIDNKIKREKEIYQLEEKKRPGSTIYKRKIEILSNLPSNFCTNKGSVSRIERVFEMIVDNITDEEEQKRKLESEGLRVSKKTGDTDNDDDDELLEQMKSKNNSQTNKKASQNDNSQTIESKEELKDPKSQKPRDSNKKEEKEHKKDETDTETETETIDAKKRNKRRGKKPVTRKSVFETMKNYLIGERNLIKTIFKNITIAIKINIEIMRYNTAALIEMINCKGILNIMVNKIKPEHKNSYVRRLRSMIKKDRADERKITKLKKQSADEIKSNLKEEKKGVEIIETSSKANKKVTQFEIRGSDEIFSQIKAIKETLTSLDQLTGLILAFVNSISKSISENSIGIFFKIMTDEIIYSFNLKQTPERLRKALNNFNVANDVLRVKIKEEAKEAARQVKNSMIRAGEEMKITTSNMSDLAFTAVRISDYVKASNTRVTAARAARMNGYKMTDRIKKTNSEKKDAINIIEEDEEGLIAMTLFNATRPDVISDVENIINDYKKTRLEWRRLIAYAAAVATSIMTYKWPLTALIMSVITAGIIYVKENNEIDTIELIIRIIFSKSVVMKAIDFLRLSRAIQGGQTLDTIIDGTIAASTAMKETPIFKIKKEDVENQPRTKMIKYLYVAKMRSDDLEKMINKIIKFEEDLKKKKEVKILKNNSLTIATQNLSSEIDNTFFEEKKDEVNQEKEELVQLTYYNRNVLLEAKLSSKTIKNKSGREKEQNYIPIYYLDKKYEFKRENQLLLHAITDNKGRIASLNKRNVKIKQITSYDNLMLCYAMIIKVFSYDCNGHDWEKAFERFKHTKGSLGAKINNDSWLVNKITNNKKLINKNRIIATMKMYYEGLIISNELAKKFDYYSLYFKREMIPLQEINTPKPARSLGAPNSIVRGADFYAMSNYHENLKRDIPHNGVIVGYNMFENFTSLWMLSLVKNDYVITSSDYSSWDASQHPVLMEANAFCKIKSCLNSGHYVNAEYLKHRYLRHCLRINKFERVENINEEFNFLTIGQQGTGDITTSLDNSMRNVGVLLAAINNQIKLRKKTLNKFVKKIDNQINENDDESNIVICCQGDDNVLISHKNIKFKKQELTDFVNTVGLELRFSNDLPFQTKEELFLSHGVDQLAVTFKTSHDKTKNLRNFDKVDLITAIAWKDSSKIFDRLFMTKDKYDQSVYTQRGITIMKMLSFIIAYGANLNMYIILMIILKNYISTIIKDDRKVNFSKAEISYILEETRTTPIKNFSYYEILKTHIKINDDGITNLKKIRVSIPDYEETLKKIHPEVLNEVQTTILKNKDLKLRELWIKEEINVVNKALNYEEAEVIENNFLEGVLYEYNEHQEEIYLKEKINLRENEEKTLKQEPDIKDLIEKGKKSSNLSQNFQEPDRILLYDEGELKKNWHYYAMLPTYKQFLIKEEAAAMKEKAKE